MERYQDRDGDSGVVAFEITSTRIEVTFSSGRSYSYSYHKAGRAHVEHMKTLAKNGDGLNSYINKHVKYLYD